MKTTFPQYATKTPAQYASLWREALVVLDANVLLNLYRYREQTRDELLVILARLQNRVWIPHHVGLEFYRNRLKVISEQSNRFDEVRKVVTDFQKNLRDNLGQLQVSTRHAQINPESLLHDIDRAIEEYYSVLDKQKENQPAVSEDDSIRDAVEEIFRGRVGAPISDQASLDNLYAEAKKRAEARIPPGYEDGSKAKETTPKFISGGLIYERQYGDFLVWIQMLDHARSAEHASVLFITDDAKEDWWRIVGEGGPKVLGPREELIDEARTRGGITNFHMYKPERFLKYARDDLNLTVSEGTLEDVRAVSAVTSMGPKSRTRTRYVPDEILVYWWLLSQYEDVHYSQSAFTDFIVRLGGQRVGYSIQSYAHSYATTARVRRVLAGAIEELNLGILSHLVLVWVVSDELELERTATIVSLSLKELGEHNLTVVIGERQIDSDSSATFLPIWTYQSEPKGRSATARAPDEGA